MISFREKVMSGKTFHPSGNIKTLVGTIKEERHRVLYEPSNRT